MGWKGLPGINPLAYYERSSITAVKSFITLDPVRRGATREDEDAILVHSEPTDGDDQEEVGREKAI